MLNRRALLVAGLPVAVASLVLGAFLQQQVSGSDGPGTEVAALRIEAPTTTVAPTTTTSTTTTEPPPPPLRTATLAFTGDTLAHRGVVRQARANAADAEAEYDFTPMYTLVEPYLAAADVAICHLETPLSPDNRDLSGWPTFNVPRELADALDAAGYDGCTVASNHSLDRRPQGVVDTLDVLDAAGLAHSGTARSAAERATPTLYDAAGIAVANLSYTYGLNGFSVPGDSPWLVNLIDPDTIRADAESARAEGAEYVIVSLHWGTEYRVAPSAYQLDVAEALLDSDAIDLIVGHHAHVVQPIDLVDGTYVVYGLGNFLSNQSAGCCVAASQDGVIVQVHVQERRDPAPGEDRFATWITYVPTWVDRSDYTIVPVVEALAADDVDPKRRRTLEVSRERTAAAIAHLDTGPLGVVEARPLASN